MRGRGSVSSELSTLTNRRRMIQMRMNIMSARPIAQPMTTPAIVPFDNPGRLTTPGVEDGMMTPGVEDGMATPEVEDGLGTPGVVEGGMVRF